MLSQQEQKAWIRLAFSEKIGPITFANLLKYFGSAEKALDNLPVFCMKSGRKRPLTVLPEATYTKAMEALKNLGGNVLFKGQEDYPKSLAVYEDSPIILFTKGNTRYLDRKALAIVGTRTPTLNSSRFAHHLAKTLASYGYTIVSGLASGIDTAAHEGALEAKGRTVAVLGTPLDKYYPKGNEDLQNKIAQDGCLVSEFLIGTPVGPGRFPMRNRIISGLSLGVAVIEAAMDSGSLHTAKFGLNQGKEIFAVPGFPLDPRFRGTNNLIKNGAHLLSSPEDVYDVLEKTMTFDFSEHNISPTTPAPIKPYSDNELSEAQSNILNLIGTMPIDVDTLIQETGMPTALVQITLTGLELADQIERLPGNKISRIFIKG